MNFSPPTRCITAGVRTRLGMPSTIARGPMLGLALDKTEGVGLGEWLETLQQSEPAAGAGHRAPQQVNAGAALANDPSHTRSEARTKVSARNSSPATRIL